MVFLSGVRYRIAILPVLIIFAAGGVNFINSTIKSRSKNYNKINKLATTIAGASILILLTVFATIYDIYQKIGGGKVIETLEKVKGLLFN
jgi:amino acid permease